MVDYHVVDLYIVKMTETITVLNDHSLSSMRVRELDSLVIGYSAERRYIATISRNVAPLHLDNCCLLRRLEKYRF